MVLGIFSNDNVVKLLLNKFVVFIGDSVQRSAYKDLIVLLKENRFIRDAELKMKGENSFNGDQLVERSTLNNGISYREVREYKTDHVLVRFYFITRIYNEYVESIIKDFEDADQPTPDVVFVNSCLWDLSRYGSKPLAPYSQNLEKFCCRLDKALPVNTCIIWRTALPLGEGARGGVLVDKKVNRNALLADVCVGNYRAHAVVTRHKYDVIDMHFHFATQLRRLAKDGVHWNQYAHRRMTNMFLSHISQAWGLGVPSNPFLENVNNNFDTQEINLNTTSLLQHAYTPNIATQRRPQQYHTAEEQRYGGPIRSGNEMFNFYNNFYNFEQENHSIEEPQVNPYQFFHMDHPPAQSFQPYDFRREKTQAHIFPSVRNWSYRNDFENYGLPLQPNVQQFHMDLAPAMPRPPFFGNGVAPYSPVNYPNQFIARQYRFRHYRKLKPYPRHKKY